ncbi:alpha/beta hydrolase [Pontixanthobacter aquaemixtae]|uniref:Alpha/beta hydrolase n=1 Tax=Pontixanthobacter aquaemixtae TaxID=1958940 RepID=A0A845A272_9SPHN|nr:alpha/beta hydrolase [Pontixanthobacter aquaemixtae]MXO91729.1 alpha/beta hydrolase [Pontixanthobacter aquaemixtae]
MRSVVKTFILFLSLIAAPASAQLLSVETYVEEWNEAQQKWVRVEDGADRLASGALSAPAHSAPESAAIASYGPFRVIDDAHAELVGVTDRSSPTDFAAMLRDFPGLKTLKLVEAPGTDDDRANMKVGRMLRAAGIDTHVPNGGSVRSGAVELFLAGANRRIDDGAEFAVHSWIDGQGRQPSDFAMTAAPNLMYLNYYQEMGMTSAEATAFYAMTNSVDFADAKWLTAQDMREWLGQKDPASAAVQAEVTTIATQGEKRAEPRIAYLDLSALLP